MRKRLNQPNPLLFFMKEKLLVLAKACPEVSSKYESLVCVAGITDKGDWRRIYPIPWAAFWEGKNTKFRKKWWIEYELESDEPSDHRPESRKVIFDTIHPLREAPFSEILDAMQGKFSTIEGLADKGQTVVSLGAVKPIELLDFKPTDNDHYKKMMMKKGQQTLDGGQAVLLDAPKYKYRFVFRDRTGEGAHEMLCEDWEGGELYRNCEEMRKKGKYPDENTVHEKVKAKMMEVAGKPGAFFIVGTHFRFGTYMVVGVVYPKKSDLIIVQEVMFD